MKRIALGLSGELVSQFALGTMYFGSTVDEKNSYEMLDFYMEKGGNFIDTSNNYIHWIPPFQGGESEKLLGKWMQERGNRDQVFLATKIGFESKIFDLGMKPWQIRENIARSLDNLKTDSIDLLYIHRDDPDTPLEDSLGTLNEFVQAGQVRHLGLSNFTAPRIEQVLEISDRLGYKRPCCLQNRMTYLPPEKGFDTSPQVLLGKEQIAVCDREQLTKLAFSPLLQGAYCLPERPLPEGYATPENAAKRAELFRVAGEIKATPNQVVLAWMRHQDIIPMVTGENKAQLEENLNAEGFIGKFQL